MSQNFVFMSVLYLHFYNCMFLSSKKTLQLAHSRYQDTKIFVTKVWGGSLGFNISKSHFLLLNHFNFATNQVILMSFGVRNVKKNTNRIYCMTKDKNSNRLGTVKNYAQWERHINIPTLQLLQWISLRLIQWKSTSPSVPSWRNTALKSVYSQPDILKVDFFARSKP